MKQLDTQDLLEYSRAAVAVLRTLQLKDETMTYADFARAIGLLDGPAEVWKAWHRQQTEAVLNAVAATEKLARKQSMKLEYNRIVTKLTGESGTGKSQLARLIQENGPRSRHAFVELNSGIAVMNPDFDVVSHIHGNRRVLNLDNRMLGVKRSQPNAFHVLHQRQPSLSAEGLPARIDDKPLAVSLTDDAD